MNAEPQPTTPPTPDGVVQSDRQRHPFPTGTRELDVYLKDRAAVLVDLDALTDLPRTALSSASPALLAAGVAGAPNVPAPLLRLLHRARSLSVPCVLLAPALDHDLEPRLLDLRVAFLWSAAVPTAEHLAAGTNTYRAAADTLGLSVQRCLAVSPAADTSDAATSGARIILASRAGDLTRLAKSPSALSDIERDVARLLALGHSSTSAATALGKSRSTVVTQAWKLNQRYGYPDRTRTIAHLIAHRLIDTAPLRATLPTPLPKLPQGEGTVLALLARHDPKATARLMDVSEGTVKMLGRRARTLLGARNRTHAVVIALLAGITAPPPATASAAAVDFGLAP